MTDTPQKKKHILVVSQYFYPEAFRINDMCAEWVRRGEDHTLSWGIHPRQLRSSGQARRRSVFLMERGLQRLSCAEARPSHRTE